MHFFRAGFAHHAHDLAACGAAHNGVVHQYDALALNQGADGVQLQLYAKITNGLRRLDERAANVVIADQPHAKRDAGLRRVSHSRGHSRVRNRHDDVGIDGMFFGQRAAQRLSAFVDGAAKDNAVRPREINVLENALLARLFRRETNGLNAGARDAHHFAGLDFADVLRIQQIERARFRGHQPGVAQPAEIQRAEAARVAHGDQLFRGEHQQGVRAFHLVQRVTERAGEIARLRACNQMNDHFRVAVGLKDRATVLELAPPFCRVRQVSVVAERYFALVAIDHDGLRIQQRFVACGGIARVADRQIAGKIGQDRWRKYFLDFTHRTVEVQFAAIAGDDSSRFLAAMLQRVQAKVGQLRRLFMAEYAEHTTFVVKTVVCVSEFWRHFMWPHGKSANFQ